MMQTCEPGAVWSINCSGFCKTLVRKLSNSFTNCKKTCDICQIVLRPSNDELKFPTVAICAFIVCYTKDNL